MGVQPEFFDTEERLRELSEAGDPLERLLAVVDFEIFRADLDAALRRSDRRRGGRPPLDAVMMFKILVLQALYGLSDEACPRAGQGPVPWAAEYQIRDRLPDKPISACGSSASGSAIGCRTGRRCGCSARRWWRQARSTPCSPASMPN